MTTTSKFDLLVVGGGVLGTFHAYHALQMGLKVALIERHQAPRGATIQNFGQIVPSGMNLKWQRFGRKSLEIYHDIQQHIDLAIRQNGSIYLASNEEEMQLIEELHQINKANDYTSKLLTTTQCVEKYPNIRQDYCKGALFFPQEVSANPRLMIHQLQRYLCAQDNFTFFPNTTIQDLDINSDGSVTVYSNNQQQFTGEKVIVCSGSEFKTLFPELFQNSDLELVKLQMLRLKPQQNTPMLGNILTGLSIRRYESFSECPSYASIKAKEDNNSFWKKWGVHILFKQEADGSIILGDSHEYADAKDADQLGFDLRNDINDYFIEEGKKIFDLEHWNIDLAWAGYYSQSKESDLLSTTIENNIHIITGIGGKGMTGSAGFSFYNLKACLEDSPILEKASL